MVNTSKLVVIAFLVGLNIILCSVFTGLHLIYVRRFAFYESKKRRKQSFGGKVIRHEHISMNHDDSFNNSNTHLNSSKTIRSSTPPNSLNDLHIHSRPRARHSNDISTIAEAHLKQALRWIPFERDGPFDGNGIHRFSKDSDLHRQKRKKVESTKLSKRRTKKNNHDKQQGEVSIYIRQLVNAWSKWLQGESATVQEEWKSNHTEDGFVYKQAKEALYHLEQAAHLGNHHAQNMLANTLASGILPVTNILGKNHSGFIARTLLVPTDFAYGGEQLAQAIILWHMSAMQGNIEAAMALGFRHEYSAAMGQYPSKTADTAVRTLITNEDVTATLRFKRWDANNEMSNIHVSPKSQLLPTDKGLPLGHSANPTAHYGVLGTCESAMLYYESAANTIMDELEASPLRGKISPAIDRHNLAQIQMRGTSSALEYTDKPDESEEAIQYYRMRASRKNANPDVNAAYTLAQYYHYGIRGVQQSMSLALHYYEIAADHKHWEAAGQAGKFHLWSIGIDENARNLKKAYQYFKMGMPGGIGECRYRFEARSHKKARALDNNGNMDEDGDLDSESDLLTLCDHPCINGMGLLYVFGVPDLVPIDIALAKEHFNLAKDMGNMDAFYNLAMLSLGWSNDSQAKDSNIMMVKWNDHDEGSGPTKADFLFAQDNLARAASMGHIQAKHRLAMMHARGIYFYNEPHRNRPFEVIPKNCPKALSLFKDIADNGTTMSRRLRSAYKQYISGQFESSLRNYLAAAETGSEIAQINAAFLLEQGHCLGMTRNQCMKASLRMWRAAARQGSEEACLRIGDFFYYGREYGDNEILDRFTERKFMYKNSPYPWIQYLVYPEDLLQGFARHLIPHIASLVRQISSKRDSILPSVCTEGTQSSDTSCSALYGVTNDTLQSNHTRDLGIAVQYYRQAAEQHGSPRANFNLGNMYEWGMGLRQDFPMAKRHYDLAGTARSKEAAVAVQLALFCMNIHEALVRLKLYMESTLPTLLTSHR